MNEVTSAEAARIATRRAVGMAVLWAAMPAEPILDAELADFLQSGVAMHAASTSGRTPEVTRAAGCRVAPDRGSVTIYVVESHSEALLAAVRASGAIAVVFTRPTSHRAVQLKGIDARVVPPVDADLELIERQVDIFDAELASMRFAPQLGRTLLGGVRPKMAAITFTPSCAFEQTPGPAAGMALKRA